MIFLKIRNLWFKNWVFRKLSCFLYTRFLGFLVKISYRNLIFKMDSAHYRWNWLTESRVCVCAQAVAVVFLLLHSSDDAAVISVSGATAMSMSASPFASSTAASSSLPSSSDHHGDDDVLMTGPAAAVDFCWSNWRWYSSSSLAVVGAAVVHGTETKTEI